MRSSAQPDRWLKREPEDRGFDGKKDMDVEQETRKENDIEEQKSVNKVKCLRTKHNLSTHTHIQKNNILL